MSLPIVLRPEAQFDLLAARDWYDKQRAGLGEEFADAVDQILIRIQTMPELYAVVLHEVRRGKLRRFPYVVYYRILAEQVEVIGVLHGGRDPRTWQDRT
jgi:plasmid stabilization system protein ParE